MLAVVPSVSTLVVVPVFAYAVGGAKVTAGFVVAVVVLVASVWMLIQIHRARLLGGAIRVNSDSFPQVQAVVDDVCHRLAYQGRLEVWIVEQLDGQVSLTSYLGTKMILVEGGLASDLVADDKRAQLTFLVGRFVGALKAKHLRLTPLQVAVAGIKSLKFLNVFIRPYERTIVYSGDQIGLACAGSLGAGLGVISRLLVGKEVAPELGAAGVLKQAHEARHSVLPRIAQLTSSYPHLTNRYLNLLRFGEQFECSDYEAAIATIGPEIRAELASSQTISRGRLAPWLVGVPSVAIAGVIAAIAVSGGLPAATAASTASSAATTTVHHSPPTLDSVSRSVSDLTRIVDQSSLGRQAAIAGDWQAAIDNRQQTLEQLKTLKLSPQLAPFRQLLGAALTYSLLADQATVDCGSSSDCRQADYYDSLATTSKRQFLVPFNRVMRAYGARQYQETDF